MFLKKLVKQAIGALVIEFVGSAAQKAGEMLAERSLAKYAVQEVEVVEVKPRRKRK